MLSRGKNVLADGGVCIFVTFAQSITFESIILQFSACLEWPLLKRRTTVALFDLASRTYARVEPIHLSAI